MPWNPKLLVAMALVALSPLLVACGDDDDNAITPASVESVAIADFAFEPNSVTVAPGTTVTWVNEDRATHTATADDDAPVAFDSGDLGPDEDFQHTFEELGTYFYGCAIHPTMRGEIVVEG
jgi:plastocyanin